MMSRRLYKCKIAKANVSGTQGSFFFFAIGSDQNFLFLPLKGIDAPYMPDTFVINIGDQFARWTSE